MMYSFDSIITEPSRNAPNHSRPPSLFAQVLRSRRDIFARPKTYHLC